MLTVEMFSLLTISISPGSLFISEASMRMIWDGSYDLIFDVKFSGTEPPLIKNKSFKSKIEPISELSSNSSFLLDNSSMI